jgi:hypothetical protein
MKTSPVSGGLHSRNIRQLNKTVRRYSGAETPPFRMTGLEIGEFPATDSVDKKIIWLLIQRFGSTVKSSAELFQLTDIHERTRPRLTNGTHDQDHGTPPDKQIRVSLWPLMLRSANEPG